MKSALVTLAAFTMLLQLENRFPLRRRRESVCRHVARNLCVALGAAAVITFIEIPLSRRLSSLAEGRRVGLAWWLRLKEPLRSIVAIALTDYTMYLWHVGSHRIPLLWRFHLAHHIDRDLDASTALRFHAGEILLSIPWRAFQIFLSGTSPDMLRIWHVLFFAEVVFHHSNVRLPIAVERVLNRLIVTPRMHGIHHADIREAQNSNLSSGLVLWDRLHGTLRLNLKQDALSIGVPGFERNDISCADTLSAPFLADDGEWTGVTASTLELGQKRNLLAE